MRIEGATRVGRRFGSTLTHHEPICFAPTHPCFDEDCHYEADCRVVFWSSRSCAAFVLTTASSYGARKYVSLIILKTCAWD